MNDSIDIVRTTVDAFNADDLDACLARMAPDFVMHLADYPQPLGREAWQEGNAMMRRAFPDLHVQIDDILASGDRVAARLTLSGTHSGDYLGHAPTGRSVSYVSHEFYRLADDLIAEEWICSDTATLMLQLA